MAIVGIDLGTTTSEIAYMKGKDVVVIPNLEEGNSNIVPSIIFIENNKIKVGNKAKNQTILKAKNTVTEIKRLIGSNEKIEIDDREYTPIEISAIIIKKLKEIGEFYIGEEITEAVITVPANFNDKERRATKKAGELSGLKIERIINEPTAAAIAYGINNIEKEEMILVYDLGGGTFDISILELSERVLDVKCSRGNNHLGGKDIDEKLIDFIVEEFYKKEDIILDKKDKRVLNTLKRLAEEAKIELSSEDEVDIICPYITVKNNLPIDLNINITIEKFNDLIKDLIKSTENTIDEALQASRVKAEDITKVIAVGGSTRIPYIRKMLNKKFNNKLITGINPEEVVAIGAAIQGGIKKGIEKELIITDSVSHTLGVEVIGNEFDPIIKRDSKLPAEATNRYRTIDDNQQFANIRVYEGEELDVDLNTFISEFELTDIPPNKKGEEKIEITFRYDLNGILNITAQIISIGKVINKKINVNRTDNLIEENAEKEIIKQINLFEEKKTKVEEYTKEIFEFGNEIKEDLIKDGLIEEKVIEEKVIEEKVIEENEEKEENLNEENEENEEELNEENKENAKNEENISKYEEEKLMGKENSKKFEVGENVEVKNNLEEYTEKEIYSDTVNLTNYVNKRMSFYNNTLQKEIRDKLSDLLGHVQNKQFKEARTIQLEIIDILPEEF